MRRRVALLGLLMALAVPATFLAHEGHEHVVMGIVTAVNAEHVEVKTQDGKVVTAHLTKDTKYFNGQEPATLADVKIGIRIVLHLTGEGENPTVREVRLPAKK